MEKKLAFVLYLVVFFYLAEQVHGQIYLQSFCEEGEVKPCGPDKGICVPGNSTCINGSFRDCIGGITPQEEICNNGLDDNCNGQIDECIQVAPSNIGPILIITGVIMVIFGLLLSRIIE